jgi:hypothetical protein
LCNAGQLTIERSHRLVVHFRCVMTQNGDDLGVLGSAVGARGLHDDDPNGPGDRCRVSLVGARCGPVEIAGARDFRPGLRQSSLCLPGRHRRFYRVVDQKSAGFGNVRSAARCGAREEAP